MMPYRYWLLACLTWFICREGWAQEAGQSPKPEFRGISHVDVFQWLFALIAVLVIFAGLVWMLRKSGVLHGAHKDQLAIVAGLSLGVRERLILVKVGEKQLLLGITPGRMETLLILEGDQRLFLQNGSQQQDVSFARQLQQIMQGRVDVE